MLFVDFLIIGAIKLYYIPVQNVTVYSKPNFLSVYKAVSAPRRQKV